MTRALGFWIFGAVCGGFVVGLVTWLTIAVPLNECERTNNVYQCKLVPMPVDPFQGEHE